MTHVVACPSVCVGIWRLLIGQFSAVNDAFWGLAWGIGLGDCGLSGGDCCLGGSVSDEGISSTSTDETLSSLADGASSSSAILP